MMAAIHFGLKINWCKVLFGVLEEMVDRTVKKAKGYGAQISVLLNSVPTLTMGEATHFPSSKILSPKTVLKYITTNQTADNRGQSDEGGKTPVEIVKRASKSKKKSEPTSDAPVEIVSEVVGSKKRPAVEGSEPVVPKKRRTTKGKASASSANMDMASVAQDAVPLQLQALKRKDEPAGTGTVKSTGEVSYKKIYQQEATVQSAPVHLDGDAIPLEDNVSVQTTFPAATADLSPLLDDLKTSLSQRMDNAHSDILSRLHTIERGLQNTLGHQNDYFRNLIQSARQEGQNQDDLQILRLNELKKTVMAQGVTADTDSLAVRNRFNALDAKILLLDGQFAAIRSEQLEFQAKIAADLLSLSTQIGDLVDYIRGGDAKKGEGISSRRPLPTPVNQGESSGNVVRTTEIISQTDIDTAQRDIMERMMRAYRERDRERRERRLSRSGSYKRRRGY
ncbi:nuclear matrix constituent protein 1-like protein [Dorcoceras hygrometricum]|uniref:Nuclear matrix constituent protein 1-like protein n=1 Tax=Dorcoceras hygrometricum TaxID=472368 RepID=A0A2Z7CSN5_9LAMI|nr:nuclear matrix constituent protein 1-like protein [Dorcoceras hygrometricum]